MSGTNEGTRHAIRISTILSATGILLARHSGALVLLAVLYFLPLFLLLAIGAVDPAALIYDDAPGFWTAGFLLPTFLILLMDIPMSHICLQSLQGRKVGVLDAIRNSAPHILPVVIAGFAASALAIVGLLALLIPGLIVMTYFAVLIPAIIAEDLGPVAAFRRSASLVRRNFWRTLTVVLLYLVPSVLLDFLVPDMAPMMQASLTIVSDLVLMTVTVPLTAALYVELVERSQGIGPADIETIFE